ncbi:MAG TPA: sodium-independent anion transporter, partial [Burkholderiaceae bacterium]|nr:sodium-independent anion transporter [Burkholderiaceae bacterium]
IIIAVAPLIDVRTFVRTWRYDRADALALAATFAGVLALGVEAGIAAGVGASLATLVWRTHRPHIAVVGRVPGTQHFRNVARQRVDTQPRLLALRIDENLLFTNARPIEQRILQHVDAESDVADVVLVMSSVNRVDASGAEMLAELAHALRERGLRLHLAEIKGPLADRLARSETLAPLARSAFLSTHLAFEALSGGTGR